VSVQLHIRSAIRWAISGLAAGLVALPAGASAGADPSGGATAPSGVTGVTGPTGQSGPVGPTGPLAATGTLTVVPASIQQGQLAVAGGVLPASDAGRAVLLQVQTRTAWATVARARIGAGGGFAIGWRPRRTGEVTLRAVSAGATPKAATTATTPPAATADATLAIYQPVIATWYGPGFYGQHTACGQVLTRALVGVADRTLPCGTPVSLSYDGETLVVPVIDRGPYGDAATLDLTHGAAVELGITTTVTLGMIDLAGPPLAPTNWPPQGSSPAGTTGTTGTIGPTGLTGPTALAGGATAPSG